MTNDSLRIVLAEDSTLLRMSLVTLLERHGAMVLAEVERADGLLPAVRAHSPSLVITDVRMPPGHRDDGLRAAVAVRREQPQLPVVVLSQYVERSYLGNLLESGDGRGVGYLLKERVTGVAGFMDALHRVADGGTAIDPTVVAQLMSAQRSPVQRLTPRERDVLALMAEGLSNTAIATRLTITGKAVDKHISNVLMKLDLPPESERNRRVAAVLTYLKGSA